MQPKILARGPRRAGAARALEIPARYVTGYLAAEGEDEARLRTLAASEDVAERVFFAGSVLPTASHPGGDTLGWDGLAALIAGSPLPVFAIGFVTAFVFAMIAVKGLLKFIASHSYAAFAWYRIAFGLLILATWQFGWIDWAAAKP